MQYYEIVRIFLVDHAMLLKDVMYRERLNKMICKVYVLYFFLFKEDLIRCTDVSCI